MDIKLLALATEAANPHSADSLYYRLRRRYFYGGWTDAPAAVVDLESGKFKRVSGVTKTVLDMADGKVNFNLALIPEAIRTEAAKLEAAKVLERCEYGAPARLFRKYNNHLVLKAEWAITGRCNFKCKHCFLSAPEARFGELSLDDCKRLIREMAEAGIRCVSITGGEPLLRSDLQQLLDELIRYDIRLVDISCNGSLVNEKLLDQLETRGQKPNFYMSFDGVGWHDWLRGIEGAEKMLMGKFELLAKRGYHTGSAFTMHKRNAAVLRESINQLASVGVKTVIVNRMLPFGEWQKYGQDFNITHREVFETYLDYLPHFFEDGMPARVYLNRMISLEYHSYDYIIQPIGDTRNCENNKLCPSVFRAVFITGDGRLAPCISISGMEGQEKNFADLSKMSMSEALEHSAYAECAYKTVGDFFRVNRECAECEYKCYCQGGCRSQALEFDDTNYMGIERHRCEFFREHYTEQILKRLADTVPQARCTNIPEGFPLLKQY